MLRLLWQGVRRLGGADELDELRAVAEGIVTARRLRDLQHVVIAEGAGLAAAAQDLAETRDGGRETGVLRRGLEAGLLGGAVDRCRDQLADIRFRQLVADLHEGIFVASRRQRGWRRLRGITQGVDRARAADG